MPPKRSATMLIALAFVVLIVIALTGEFADVVCYLIGLALGLLMRRPSRSP